MKGPGSICGRVNLTIEILYLYMEQMGDIELGIINEMSDYWSWGRGFDPRHFQILNVD